jgi:GNAT superfamily N-acetyltransferase
MTITEVIKEKEKKFESFGISMTTECRPNMDRIVFMDNEKFVGDVHIEPGNEVDVVKKIYVSTNYQGLGYSKIMLKFAQEFAKMKGKEGIIVKDQSQSFYSQNRYKLSENY